MDGDNFRLSGSEETLAALGERVGQRLIETAQKNVLIITREDLAPGYRQSGVVDGDIAMERLKGLFNKAGLTGLSPEQLKQQVQNVFSEFAYAQNLRGSDGNVSLGLLVAPNLDATAEDVMSIATGLPNAVLKDLPGRDRDYVDAVIGHESKHLAPEQEDARNNYQNFALPYEVDADRHMIKEIMGAAKDGTGMDARVADTMMDARVMRNLTRDMYDIVTNPYDMNKMFGGHSTHLRISHAEANGLPHDPGADPQATLTVNSMVNQMTALYFQTEGLRELQEGTLNPADRIFETRQDYLDSLTHPIQYAQKISEYLKDDPAMAYEAMKALREKNYIKDGTPEAEYADNVIGFFDRHIERDALPTDQADAAREFFEKIPTSDVLMKQHDAALDVNVNSEKAANVTSKVGLSGGMQPGG